MSRVVVNDLGWIRVKSDANKLAGYFIEAGLFADAISSEGEPLAQRGFWAEYGTENAPSRPWLSGGAAFVERVALKEIARIVNQIGKLPSDPEALLKPLAKAIATGIQTYAIDGPFAPNAESTKKRKGFNWPLVETGEMIDAIDGRVKHTNKLRGAWGRLNQ